MDKPNVTSFLIILFLCCAWTGESKHSHCLKHLNTCGFTVPSGDIVLEYGQPLNITCNMYEDIAVEYGDNASSGLYFIHGNQAVPQEMVEIVNSTSIRLYIERPWKVANENFYCNFNESLFTPQSKVTQDKLVCMNVVVVGVAPQNVTDFSCIGRNFENLTCSWTEPENYVKTHYNLSYTFTGRAARKNRYYCPELKTVDKSLSCFWNISSRPQYRQVQPIYIFTLNMTNRFGTNTVEYVFDHFKHVISNRPENLTAIATSPHSINLTWAIPTSMVGFPRGLHHRILYQCEYEKKWHFGGMITTAEKNDTLNFELTNMKYAHNLCDIRVSIRSADAVEDDTVWSENATVTERTKSKIPDCPPATTDGSFEIINEFNLTIEAYVYWQTIEPEQENGQNLTYEVRVDSHPDLRYTELTKTYARFTNLSLSTYVISIWSKNEEGFSSEKSTVVIPASRPALPQNFIKLEHQGLVELNWDAPVHSKIDITNYTIFWCDNDRDRPHQCKGRLNWITVPRNASKYNVSLSTNDLYQFAISANSHGSSSGMLWAECTFIPNKAVGKMRNIWISRVGSTFIELGWKLDCSDRIQSVTGYVIFYCPMKSTEQKQCTEPVKNVTINDKTVHSGIVDNLKPYNMYRLTLSVIMSLDSYSQPSDFLINSTNEDAPSTPPLNVSVTKITNSSVSLKWLPPTEMNGKLRDYIINYATDTVYKSVKPGNDVNTFTLSDLDSYETYWITMQACTTKCSEPSENITVLTHMWIPGEIEEFGVISYNDSVTTIGWKPPYPSRGPIDYYQLKFTHDQSENESMEAEVNVTNTLNYTIEECGQSGKYNNIYVSVRAVNIIDGLHKHGPWSKQLKTLCFHSLRPYFIMCGLAVFIIVCAGVIFGFRKMYACCKSMQDVEVKLPPGLAPVIEQRDLVPWNSEKNPDDIDRTSRADEELLLEKMSELRASADSSGCSSGHESLTSSLESNTHMSIDSGTDQPRSVGDENRRNSLRQRNVSSKGYVLPEAVQTGWGPKAPVPAGNYCVLGVDPNNKSDPNLPYLPIADGGSTVSLPYISCDLSPNAPKAHAFPGEFVKTPNPGYVPYTANEPASKNTGYVLAGLSKDLVPEIRQGDSVSMTTNIDDKPYLKMDVPVNPKSIQLAWHQPVLEPTKTGYVSVGDAPPPKALKEAPKGYVPHRQFEAKALKED